MRLAGLIPQNVLDEISARLSIVDVASSYLTLTERGGRYWALCPFHTEKTPSFTVTPEKNVYYCFGCHKGGTIYTLVQEVENLSFREAAELLAAKAGIEIPKYEEPGESSARKSVMELYGRVAGSFAYILRETEPARAARDYLKRRGISSESTDLFGLGYAPSDGRWLYGFLKEKSYSPEFLAGSGLFSSKNPEWSFFTDRLIFPIRNRRSETIAFGGRMLGKGEPKYLNSSESLIFNKKSQLYGLDIALSTIRKLRTFILVEGYLDVIALRQIGIENAVAPLGTSLTPGQIKLLRRYSSAGSIVFDGDEAGLQAAMRAVTQCEREGVQANVVALEAGRDPADFVEQRDTETLKNALEYPIKGFTFVLQTAIQNNEINKPEGKEAVLRFLLPYIDVLASEIRRESYLEEIAEALEIGPRAVREDYFRFRDRKRNRDTFVEIRRDIDISPTLYLMLATAANFELFARVRTGISEEDLPDRDAKKLFIALEECFRTEEDSIDAVLRRIDDDRLRELIIERIASGEFEENGDLIVRESLAHVKETALRKRVDAVTARLRKSERESLGPEAEKELLEEKMYLDEEIAKLRKGDA